MMKRKRLKLSAAALGCAAMILAAAGTGAARETVILGAAAPAKASCPNNCLVEAQVTGIQTSIAGVRNPFTVPSSGNLVAWSIKLGKPKKKDRRAFNDTFGGAQARLSVLKRVKGKTNPRRYKLLRQGPVEDLAPFFGTTTTFSLTTPLPVKKGNVVALTIPNWAPAFAVGQGATSEWLASRRPTNRRGGCTDDEGRANVNAGAPQTKKGSQRPYGCMYDSARLLYTAQFVPD